MTTGNVNAHVKTADRVTQKRSVDQMIERSLNESSSTDRLVMMMMRQDEQDRQRRADENTRFQNTITALVAAVVPHIVNIFNQPQHGPYCKDCGDLNHTGPCRRRENFDEEKM